MGELSRSAKYYRSHPEARKKKAATDKKINERPAQVKKRVEANRANREAGSRKGDGKDYDHATRRFVSEKTNRGRTSGTKGDSNARSKRR
jgi:hypothetical protein